MRLRRMRLLSALKENEIAPTMSAFVMLGAQGNDGTVPPTKVGGPKTESEYISDDIINPHPRFGTLTANIRQRRGSKVNIRVPLFRDKNTPEYANFDPPVSNGDGCCGSDSQQLWRYGKGDASYEAYGREKVVVGCSTDEEFDDVAADQGLVLQKWLVDVRCAGCKGLFYRRTPGEIAPDADWPRNGDVVVGHELQDNPGWIRLQNGYYLPINSTCGHIPFLHKVSVRAHPSNSELKRIGSSVPLFRSGLSTEQEKVASLLEEAKGVTDHLVGKTATALIEPGIISTTTNPPEVLNKENVRPAIHMDAMAFGMGNGCLQVTFQGEDIEESRFMYDQLAVMAPIMMALTASTPFLKGRIADTDTRWGIISESVDCRTPAERGRCDPNAPYADYAAKGQKRIYK
jgi:Glutamate-cysteine ligase